MIKCLMDMTLPEDSKCSYCCYYCDEKETCDYSCPKVKEPIANEKYIASDCIHAYDE